MPIHEVDLDATYEDLQKFAMNILGEMPHGSQFKEIDVKVAYWHAAGHVLLTRKLDVALTTLTSAVDRASTASSRDSANALTRARQMVVATWALVAGTVLLSVATGFLVVYTRQLTVSPPTVIVQPSAQR